MKPLKSVLLIGCHIPIYIRMIRYPLSSARRDSFIKIFTSQIAAALSRYDASIILLAAEQIRRWEVFPLLEWKLKEQNSPLGRIHAT